MPARWSMPYTKRQWVPMMYQSMAAEYASLSRVYSYEQKLQYTGELYGRSKRTVETALSFSLFPKSE
jgi:hypothetical protein